MNLKQNEELSVFAIRIKQLRESLKMTQKEFGRHIGIKQQTLSGYERGLIKPPLDVAKEIAEKCHVSIDWLCGLSEKMRNDGASQTYADVINLFVDAKNVLGFEIDVKHTNCITIHDRNMKHFFDDWAKMLSLLQNGSIDNKLYELWLDSQKKEYENVRIENET